MNVARIRAGDWVEVLPAEAVAATLDERGCLDGLPFMPEMLAFTGRRFRVRQRAERTCVHPPQVPFPQLSDTVTLEGLRCDGARHGGCQLGCMLFWRTAWLRPVEGPAPSGGTADDAPARIPGVTDYAPEVAVDGSGHDERHVCQGTELPRATSPGVPLWEPRQYVQFVRDRTYTPLEIAAMFGRMGLRRGTTLLRGAPPRAGEEARRAVLGLHPGEWVRVQSRERILATLDETGRLGGLAFGGDMAADCGRTLRVERRVERILDERTGRLRQVRDTVLLENSVCERYLGCARAMPILWREAWLERVDHAVPTP